MAEEGHRYQWGETDEANGCVEEEPREMSRRAPGGFFKEAGITLEEEDVEDEVQRQRAEIEECGYESPVLCTCERRNRVERGLQLSSHLVLDEDGAEAVEELEGSDDLALYHGACYHSCCCP